MLPARAAALLVVLSVVAYSCGGGVAGDDLQGVVVESPGEKPDFVLTDTEGKSFDFAEETAGKLTLLYFGYLNCPDICPVHLAQIAESFDQLPEIGRSASVVFVTVDPQRDSPTAIREYLDRFDTRFVGLTGSVADVAFAQKAAGLPLAQKIGEGEDYTVDHAGQVLAFAPDGLGYSMYPFGTRQSEWVNDLQVLAETTPG